MSERMYNTNFVHSGLMTGTQYDVMLSYMSDQSNKSATNASNSNYFADLKGKSSWGNYSNTTLNNCRGKYCTVTSTGETSSWEDNTLGNNKQSTWVILTTGSTNDVKKKNLYDVAGNLWEITQECATIVNGGYYMFRGGSFHNQYASNPACYRAYSLGTNTNTEYGFRVMLYIK